LGAGSAGSVLYPGGIHSRGPAPGAGFEQRHSGDCVVETLSADLGIGIFVLTVADGQRPQPVANADHRLH
jgi:hypothetical protein